MKLRENSPWQANVNKSSGGYTPSCDRRSLVGPRTRAKMNYIINTCCHGNQLGVLRAAKARFCIADSTVAAYLYL